MPFRVINGSEIIETARLVDKLGFDGFVTSDHVLYHIPVFEPHIALAASASVTSHVKLSTSVSLAALRGPLVLAKMCSTLDLVSGGRFELGVGIGGEHPKEWEANQVPVKQRTRRTDEMIDIMKRVWTEDHVTYHGKYYQFDDVSMDPKPTHGIPIIVGGRSEAAIQRTANHGDGWVAIWLSPEKMKQRMALIDEQATKAGRDPTKIDKRFQVYIRIDSSKDVARASAKKFLSTAYNMPFDPLDKYTAYGTAEECAAYLKPFIELGIDWINFALIYEPGDPRETVEKVYNELLPMLSPK